MAYINPLFVQQQQKSISRAMFAYRQKAGKAADEPIQKATRTLSDGTVVLYGLRGQLASISPSGIVDDRVPFSQ